MNMDLAKLKELAQKATPGKTEGQWYLDKNGDIREPGSPFKVARGVDLWDGHARYIAAAHPQAVLELIAEVERLRAEAKAWPVTEDGVRITPGMTFYGFVGRAIASWTAEDIGFGFENGKLVWRWCLMRNYQRVGPGYYSTREAAEAAKGKK